MISMIYNILLIFFKPIYYFYRLIDNKFNQREKLAVSNIQKLQKLDHSKKIFWFHSASMGEFEQAKPVIEIIKSKNPEIQIVCSFFSPSGYDNQKSYAFADLVVYLPLDFKSSAARFIEALKPDVGVFVRYEIWRNYLSFLKKNEIPVYLICATVPSKSFQHCFPFSSFTKSNYNLFTKILTFNSEQYNKFLKLNLSTKVISSSDTRYDRIIKNVEAGKNTEILPENRQKDKKMTLILGSTWEPDEKILLESIERLKQKGINIQCIIVPHEPTESHVNHLKMLFPNAVLLSTIEKDSNHLSPEIIIVDSIGKLLQLYKYADLAYIGGGFGVGVHSVAEPAGYGIPLACGTNFRNSPDAIQLHQLGALEIIRNSEDLSKWIEKFASNAENKTVIGLKAKDYIYGLQGTSIIIAEELLNSN